MNSQIIVKPEHKMQREEATLIGRGLHNYFLEIKDGISFSISDSSEDAGCSVTMNWEGRLDSALVHKASILVREYRGVLAPFIKVK